MTQQDFYEWLQDEYALSASPDVQDFILKSIAVYIPRKMVVNRDEIEASETYLANKLKGIYRKFKIEVLSIDSGWPVSEATAIKKLIPQLRSMAEIRNRKDNIYRDAIQLNNQIIEYWKLICSQPFYESLTPWLKKNMNYVRRIEPNLTDFHKHLHENYHNTPLGRELKIKKDQEDLKNLLQIGGM